MAGWLRGASETEQLSKPAYRIERGSPVSRVLPVLLVIALLVAVGVIGLRVFQAEFAPAIRVTQLEEENARLAEDLKNSRLQVEMDAATQVELERQLAELNAQVKKLSEELSFYKRANSSKP